MAPNHGRRRALGTWVYALATCAVVAITGFATGAAAHGAFVGKPAPGPTKTTLTSVGSDGVPAALDSARPAISANGRYVAFQSDASLDVSGSVLPPAPTPSISSPTTTPPPTPPPTIPPSQSPTIDVRAPAGPSPSGAAVRPSPQAVPESDIARVYVRDQIGNTTSLLSDQSAGDATAPSISGTGKLVSYLQANDLENNVVVVNRQATGKGPFDTQQNLAVKPVTGTPNDLPFQRIPRCQSGIGDGGAMRTTPCGPKLSADGGTLVYSAEQSPISPALVPTAFGDPIPGNLVDFGETSTFFESDEEQVSYTVQGSKPVTLTGFTVSDPSFSVDQGDRSCIGTLQPGATCDIFVNFNTSACPDTTSTDTKQITATLQTDSAVPDGQSSLSLVVFCNQGDIPDAHPRPGASPAAVKPAAACQAPPKGLPVVQAPATESDNSEDNLVDFGPTVIGRPFAAIVSFTALPNSPIQFSSPDCGFQLISPASIGQPAGPSITCSTSDPAADFESCTAYVLVTPGSVGTDVASMINVPTADSDFISQVATYLSVTGLNDVVVARHDKTGAGNFAASPSTIVSVDGSGQIPDASEPSVSATGRYVAFTASGPAAAAAGTTSVWRHDTDAAGDGTFHAGPTILVSCLPAGGAGSCDAATDADSPSISGDGSQVAFATTGDQGQVYVRSVTGAATTLVSAAAGPAGAAADGDSYAPALSQDGSTVAYISTATDLAAKATPAAATNLYVRTLTPNAPLVSELVSPSGASLPKHDDIALPDIDALGGLITFQTSTQLLPAAPPDVSSVYTFEREPALAFQPAPVDFGTLQVGSKAASITVTVSDTGPGPGTLTTAGTTAPFGIIIGACAGAVLHEGDSCTVTVSLIPQQPGTDNGTLTATATDDLGTPGDFTAPITVTILQPPPHHHQEHARIALNPGVAPAGQVTDVTGSGFLDGQVVTLSWDHGLGQIQLKLKGARFTALMVIFPDDYTGPRLLQARDLTGKVLATAKFLVQQPTIWPPIGAGSAPGFAGAPG